MFSKAVLADIIDCTMELRNELEKVLSDYVSNYFPRLNTFEVEDELDIISFEEKEVEDGILVSGLIPFKMTVECFKYSNNVDLLNLKGHSKFSFKAIPDENKNPYGSKFTDIEFFDVEIE